MRTAEAIQLEYVGLCDNKDLVIQAINTAREEAIAACMEIVHDQMILSHPEFINTQLKELIKELK